MIFLFSINCRSENQFALYFSFIDNQKKRQENLPLKIKHTKQNDSLSQLKRERF